MRFLKTSLAVASSMFCSVALAGAHSNNPVLVTINGATSSFTGNIGQAHNSANNFESIQCNIQAINLGGLSSPDTLNCHALDQWGGMGSCTTSAANLVNAARSIADGDFLRVGFNDLTGMCTEITVHKGSRGEPKR